MFARIMRRFTTMGYAGFQRSLRLTFSDLEADDGLGRYLRGFSDVTYGDYGTALMR